MDMDLVFVFEGREFEKSGCERQRMDVEHKEALVDRIRHCTTPELTRVFVPIPALSSPISKYQRIGRKLFPTCRNFV